jgi:hypothetical protein
MIHSVIIVIMKRITITLEESVYDRLPKYGKSGVVSAILKTHYQKESIDQLYAQIKLRILRDKDINEWITVTAKETR